MCGILGTIPFIDPRLFASALNTLVHRGPDDSGVWDDGKSIILGHRRLSILDLTADGRQPMVSANGRYVIVFNGEIYNFIELKQELAGFGYVFKTATDTEVLLAAFDKWGPECLNKFNGMWAFAIWDTKEKKLFLSRDRFGVKPLFYAVIGKHFVFASEMKAIFPFLPEVTPSKDFAWMVKNVKTYESTEKCLIKGIKRFPVAHYGWLRNGKLKLTRYWNTLDYLTDVPARYEDQVEQFRELFLDACKIRMRSDVPVGTALSGGLDSSSVISAMSHLSEHRKESRMSRDWQHAFVACFPGSNIDESYYAKKVTDHLGIESSFLNIDPYKGMDRLMEDLYLFEEIYSTSPIPFVQTYGAMNARGIKVTIDGHAADECFGGYPCDIMYTLLDAGMDTHQIRMVLDTWFSVTGEATRFGTAAKVFRFMSWHAKRVIKEYVIRNMPDHKGHPNWRKMDNLTKQLYVSTHDAILPTLLRNYDRYSMARGVEIRMPFMDYRVVSLAFSLPWSSKIRSGYSKAIVRDAMSPFMPHEVAYRKSKIGFNTPIVDWMKGPLKIFFMDHINSQAFKTCSLVNPARTARKIMKVIEGDNVSFIDGLKAWDMFAPYLWELSVLKRYGARG